MKTPHSSPHRSRGFSLVEVMVALVVTAIGLLGLAKMESLALASTSVAGSRALAAIEASSMAAAMHANRAYWGTTIAPATTTVNAATATTAVTACTSAGACTNSTAVAQYDLQQWALALGSVLPNYFATINCTTTTLPVNCSITINWSESAVAINSAQSGNLSLALPTYKVFVEP